MSVNNLRRRLPDEGTHGIRNFVDFGLADAIEDIPSIAAVFHQAGIPKHHQVL